MLFLSFACFLTLYTSSNLPITKTFIIHYLCNPVLFLPPFTAVPSPTLPKTTASVTRLVPQPPSHPSSPRRAQRSTAPGLAVPWCFRSYKQRNKARPGGKRRNHKPGRTGTRRPRMKYVRLLYVSGMATEIASRQLKWLGERPSGGNYLELQVAGVKKK